MNKSFLIIFMCIFFLSCSTTTNEVSQNEILGTWIWVESSGGIAGTIETPQSSQKNIKLEISHHSIKRFVDNELESSHSYRFERRKSKIYGDEREMIIYENGFEQIFFTTANQLILIGDCNDCYTSEYKRE